MQFVKSFFAIICFSFILFSCKQESRPELPMDEEKAISLMGDMHFANSAALIHKLEIRDSMKEVYESQVFEIHNVTKQDYEQLIETLESDLNLYYEIEKKVHTHLKDIQNKKS